MPVPARTGIYTIWQLMSQAMEILLDWIMNSRPQYILSKDSLKAFSTTHIIEQELCAKLQIKQIIDAYQSFVEVIISTTNSPSLLHTQWKTGST